MKNLDLNSYGVQEMDTKAMGEANGGWIWGVVIGVAYDVISNWSSSKANFNKGM